MLSRMIHIVIVEIVELQEETRGKETPNVHINRLKKDSRRKYSEASAS